MRWFIKKEHMSDDSKIHLEKKDFHYLTRVRRLQPGEKLSLIVDKSQELDTKILSIEKDILYVSILSRKIIEHKPLVEIRVIQGLPKQDKMSDIINHLTQLEVAHIVPVVMDRSIVDYSSSQKEKKNKRWTEVATAASLQSQRLSPPTVDPITSFSEYIEQLEISENECGIVAWEEERSLSLKELLKTKKKVIERLFLCIGPEGGISPDEIKKLKEKGFNQVTLGRTILRTELAGVVLCSGVQYHYL
jgi:16S rRNA (uracil1498-N3)-methyltransferase